MIAISSFRRGIKRHAFKMRSRIGVDRATGKIQAFAADHVLDGGGLANLSGQVATVAATAAIGIYDIPKVDVTTVALHSRGVTAGSMRGYGTLQSMTALEVLIDEVATALPLDPIEFRRRNALKPNGRTMTGNRYSVSVRTPEILDKLEKHPIWQQRAQEKSPRSRVFSSAPASPASPRTTAPAAIVRWGGSNSRAEGKISIYCDHVEMGNGIGTALANRVAIHLGAVADEVSVARVDSYDVLGLVTSGDSYTMDQKTQDRAEKNPRWVPAISSATSASIGAHVGTHSAAEAARVIFRFGLWPAALEFWSIAAERSARQGLGKGAVERRPTHHAGSCAAAVAACWPRRRMRAISSPARSRTAFPAGTGRARAFRLPASNTAPRSMRWPSARATANSRALDRVSVRFPPTDNNQSGNTYTSMCGTLVRVEIERATGALRIAKAYSVFECGRALVPEVVLGQAQGGFAMGVGYALLETLPPFEGGPGNGQWNLGQYLVARGSDLPLRDLEIEMLPPLTPDEPPKGMAEVVMIPVVPAILNAIFDATGRRFQSLPVTASLLKGVLA